MKDDTHAPNNLFGDALTWPQGIIHPHTCSLCLNFLKGPDQVFWTRRGNFFFKTSISKVWCHRNLHYDLAAITYLKHTANNMILIPLTLCSKHKVKAARLCNEVEQWVNRT